MLRISLLVLRPEGAGVTGCFALAFGFDLALRPIPGLGKSYGNGLLWIGYHLGFLWTLGIHSSV